MPGGMKDKKKTEREKVPYISLSTLILLSNGKYVFINDFMYLYIKYTFKKILN